VIRRSLGSKLQKMVFAEQAEAGLSVKTVDVPEADRNRFCLTDEDTIELARFALKIEEHYQRPMDIEWAKDGLDGGLYIVQARPETVVSRQLAQAFQTYALKGSAKPVVIGRAIGEAGAAVPNPISAIPASDLRQSWSRQFPGQSICRDFPALSATFRRPARRSCHRRT
jgi:pyruvate,water dikinase